MNVDCPPKSKSRYWLALLALLCLVAVPVGARAAYATRLQMVRRAVAIAVLDIGPVEARETKGRHWTYSRRAEAKVVETLKGQLPPVVKLVAGEDFICARTELVEGRCLAFLTKDGDDYAGCNWHLSLRPVSASSQIEWLMQPDANVLRGKVPLETALKQIRQDLSAK
jgi:hypothetical protein